MKKYMGSKRGDIPVTILVLGVALICILAIVSFYVSSLKMSHNFDVQTVKEAKLAGEKADFYNNLGLGTAQIDSILGIKYDSQAGHNYRYIFLGRGFISVRYNIP